MYRYHTDKRIDVNGRTYNSGEIIISETPIEGLKDIDAPIIMVSEIPKEQLAKIKPRIEKPRSYGIKGKIADIIIPHHNRHDLLKNTLDAIPLDIFNIFIVAGGSFARNCNMGAKLAQTDNLIFMNDDIEPDIGLLIEACKNKADMVGFSEILPNQNNAIIHGIGWELRNSGQLSSNLRRDQRDVHIPSGFLFKMKKTAWEKLGGFDEKFKNGAEDVDLGLRVREMGLKIDYIRTGNPVIHHHMQSEGRLDKVIDNKKYLHELWPEDKIRKVLGLNRKPKRILLSNIRMENFSGTETFTYTLAKELEGRGYKVDVFTFYPGKASENLFEINPANQKDRLRMDYDYIFINHNKCLEHLKTVRGVRVLTCHGIFPEVEQPVDGADHYVSISKEVNDHLKELGYESTTLYNGIDCDRFSPTSTINKKLKNVVSICKGVKANEILQEACDRIGVGFKAIRSVKNNKIIEVKEVEDYINEADLVVSLGRGAYEAMACGRAVMVFDKRGYMDKMIGDGIVTKDNIKEIIKNNFSGRRYEIEFDVNGLVDELKKYDQSMGDINREYALKNFNIKKQVDKYFNLLDKKNDNNIMFVGSSTTEYGIAKQLEKQLVKNGYNIGYGGKKICYANDLGSKDPADGSMIILENRSTFQRALKSNADHYFCKEKSCLKFFPKNTTYLPCAIDDSIFNKQSLDRDIDIGFIGKEMFSSRTKFIKFLQDEYDNKFLKKEGIFFDKVAEFYNRCKIVPNQCPADDTNMRLFEVTACGALLITPYVPYLEELFDLEKELVIYKDMYDLKEKIDYYLEHDKEREKIARAGQRRTLKNHTYKNRVKEIIKIIK